MMKSMWPMTRQAQRSRPEVATCSCAGSPSSPFALTQTSGARHRRPPSTVRVPHITCHHGYGTTTMGSTVARLAIMSDITSATHATSAPGWPRRRARAHQRRRADADIAGSTSSAPTPRSARRRSPRTGLPPAATARTRPNCPTARSSTRIRRRPPGRHRRGTARMMTVDSTTTRCRRARAQAQAGHSWPPPRDPEGNDVTEISRGLAARGPPASSSYRPTASIGATSRNPENAPASSESSPTERGDQRPPAATNATPCTALGPGRTLEVAPARARASAAAGRRPACGPGRALYNSTGHTELAREVANDVVERDQACVVGLGDSTASPARAARRGSSARP